MQKVGVWGFRGCCAVGRTGCMNITAAKSISFTALLEALGHNPVRQGVGQEFWYLSPFRTEKTPSFKVKDDRVFYDHGEGFGGTIIDFSLRYRNSNSIKEVLEWLSQYDYLNRRDIQLKPQRKTNESNIQVNVVKPLSSWALKHYVKEVRKIDLDIARHYFKEIKYTVHDKQYFALGFANRSGSFELRNAFFKGSTGFKDISLIQSPYNPDKTLSVFEGSFDFLSVLTRMKSNYLASDVLVLNSLALQGRAIELIQSKGYQDIYTYLDNDIAGLEATKKFEQLPCHVMSQNHRYVGFKDLNEQLTNRQRGYSR